MTDWTCGRVPEAHPGDWRVAEDGRMAVEDWVLRKQIVYLLLLLLLLRLVRRPLDCLASVFVLDFVNYIVTGVSLNCYVLGKYTMGLNTLTGV
jgi:hypothetical protein